MDSLRNLRSYSRAFWLLLIGYFVNRAGAALIWPFMTVIIREQLNAPLALVTLLFPIQSIAGLLATSVIGALMDRFGRKRAMIAGLVVGAGVLVAMSAATEFWQWAILIALYGGVMPVFMVGANAMVADLVEPEERVNAYALMRLAANLGVAIGPAVGGFLIVTSLALSFYLTAALFLVLAVLVGLMIRETLAPREMKTEPGNSGYGTMLRDRAFMSFWGFYLLVEVGAVLIFSLLSVYTKENFGILEDQYGWLVTINAALVVLFQFGVTAITHRYRSLTVLAVGAGFYALGLCGMGLSSAFAGFAASMVILTIGELIISPTATALVANLAPPDQRARYMGIFSISYTLALGVAPVGAGFLNDHIAPAAMWFGGAVCSVVAMLGFLLIARQKVEAKTELAVPAAIKS